MQVFSYLIDKALTYSRHPHAPYYLAGLSFIESSVFPIPPDFMLISMSLATPQKVWRYTLLVVLSSVAGGVFGYFIGFYFFHLVEPYIIQFGYYETYQQVQLWFEQWGFWIVLVAGFSPIPYKLFTIAAGTVHMALLPFVLASLVGRALRFFVVSVVLYFAGERIQTYLHRYTEYLGWSVLLLASLAYGAHALALF